MATDRKIASGQDLEDTLKGFMTQGALNPGSGFDRTIGVGGTEQELLNRLEAWKKSKGIASSTGGAPTPTPRAAPSAPALPPQIEGPLAGLTAVAPDTEKMDMPTLSAGSGGGGATMMAEMAPMTGVASEALGQLRALGRRSPPMNTASFAGLKRLY